jgi:hypothetical protein
MKKFYSYLNTLICVSFLYSLNSCTTDTSFGSSDPSERVDAKSAINYHNTRIGDAMPANTENPYDSAGQIYNELFKTYSASDSLPKSISTIASRFDSIVRSNSAFNNIKGTDFHSLSADKVVNVISNSTISFSDCIANSEMTVVAKLSLTDFIHSLLFLSKQEDRYAVLYDFVVKYERSILTDPLLTEMDKQIILTTSSIARYSTYLIKTESVMAIDPDWGILVGHIIAGGTESTN